MKILFIGRFQPFHKGHLKTVLSLAKKEGIIKIAIGSKQLSFEKRNPFTFEERKEMIEKSLKKENIKNFFVYGLEDKNSDYRWFRELIKTTGKFDVCYSGNKHVKAILLRYKIPIKTIKRPKIKELSGTKIRKLSSENKKVEKFITYETLKVIKKIDGFERIKNINKTNKKRVFTLGHSTRNIKDFLSLIREYGIKEIIDIRKIPMSMHNPQFNAVSLKRILIKNGLQYKNIKELGGLRKASKNSINTFWDNESFRGFADYMQTKNFKKGLSYLMKISAEKRTAIMCAEALPWKCHRSLIADALVLKGFSVTHIINHNETFEHKINKHAKKYFESLVYK